MVISKAVHTFGWVRFKYAWFYQLESTVLIVKKTKKRIKSQIYNIYIIFNTSIVISYKLKFVRLCQNVQIHDVQLTEFVQIVDPFLYDSFTNIRPLLQCPVFLREVFFDHSAVPCTRQIAPTHPRTLLTSFADDKAVLTTGPLIMTCISPPAISWSTFPHSISPLGNENKCV